MQTYPNANDESVLTTSSGVQHRSQTHHDEFHSINSLNQGSVPHSSADESVSTIFLKTVTNWLHRRREKGRPTPFWERIWAALAWSQPFALAAAALVALSAAPALLLPSYLVCFGVVLGIGYFSQDETACARILLLLSGLSLCAVAAMHIAMFWDRGIADPMGWIIDGLLIGGGFILMADVLIQIGKSHLFGKAAKIHTRSTSGAPEGGPCC